MGCSGSGKSTFARRLERELGYPAIELDSYFHQRDWVPTETPRFISEVESALIEAEKSSGGWIVDGNYLSKLGELVVGSADLVIWFHLPKSVVMGRIIKRSLKRAITQEELWNGNREKLRNLFKRDPEENVIAWAWTQYGAYVQTLSEMAAKAPADQLWLEIRNNSDLDNALSYLLANNL